MSRAVDVIRPALGPTNTTTQRPAGPSERKPQITKKENFLRAHAAAHRETTGCICEYTVDWIQTG